MLIKAITLFRLRAVSDFVFVFCSLINIEEAPICHWDKILIHNFLPTVLVHFKIQTVFKWIFSKPSVFTCFVCIWSFGRARSSKCILLVSFRARRARTHTHTHTRTHTHTHTRTHTHTHTHTRARAHTWAWGTASLVWIVLSTFYYQTCPAI